MPKTRISFDVTTDKSGQVTAATAAEIGGNPVPGVRVNQFCQVRESGVLGGGPILDLDEEGADGEPKYFPLFIGEIRFVTIKELAAYLDEEFFLPPEWDASSWVWEGQQYTRSVLASDSNDPISAILTKEVHSRHAGKTLKYDVMQLVSGGQPVDVGTDTVIVIPPDNVQLVGWHEVSRYLNDRFPLEQFQVEIAGQPFYLTGRVWGYYPNRFLGDGKTKYWISACPGALTGQTPEEIEVEVR